MFLCIISPQNPPKRHLNHKNSDKRAKCSSIDFGPAEPYNHFNFHRRNNFNEECTMLKPKATSDVKIHSTKVKSFGLSISVQGTFFGGSQVTEEF